MKTLLEENVKNIAFNRPSARNQPERLVGLSNIYAAAINSFDNSSDDFNTIFQTAKLIRAKILKQDKWLFEGTFQGFAIP